MQANGSNCFYPGPRTNRALAFTPVGRDRVRPITSDETPNSITAIHQKLDLVLAGSLEQTAAIEELRKENAVLKDKLQEMNGEMQGLKEANCQSVGTRVHLKIPPNVSVSCLCMMGSCYICSV